MSFQIIRNDITKVKADAIVNTANPLPRIGAGTDSAIYTAAGENQLLAARTEIGIIDRGQSAVTPAFNLEKENGVKYIIHTVGIYYEDGTHGERTILRSCYSNSLKIARRLKCKSIAIPLLASGNYGFPKGMALDIAIEEIDDFLSEYDMDITLVVYDKEAYSLTEKLNQDIQSFIDENYIADNSENENHYSKYDGDRTATPTSTAAELKKIPQDKTTDNSKTNEKQIAPIDIDAFIKEQHQSLDFKNKLQQLIADKNIPNSEVYKNTSIDRKYFSKIISPTNKYLPKKEAVFQLGLKLELPIEDFEDFLASADYAFNPHIKSDMVVKYCVINKIFSINKVNSILFDQNLPCFYD